MQSIAEAIVKVYYGNLTMMPDTSRVLACLHEKDVKFKFLNMNKGKQPMTVDFIKLQEKALKRAAPAYEDGTTMLFDSREICRYVSENYADQGNKYLLGKDLLERASIEQWLRSEEHSFNPPSWALVFHLTIEPNLKLNPNTELIQESERKLSEILDVYNQRLGESKYLAGNEFTLADLSHLPNSHYIANSKDWSYLFNDRKYVKKWWKRISERRSWIEAVRKIDEAKHELWPSTSGAAAVEETVNKLEAPKTAKPKEKKKISFPSKKTHLPSKHKSDQPSEPPDPHHNIPFVPKHETQAEVRKSDMPPQMYKNIIHQQQSETFFVDLKPSQHSQMEIEESPETTSQDIPSLPPTQSQGHQYPDALSDYKGKSKPADLAQGAIPKKPALQPIGPDGREAKPIDRNIGISEGETEDDSELPKTTESAEKNIGKKASAKGGTTGTPTTESENNRAFTTASEAPRSAEKSKEVPKPAIVCDQPTELPVSSDVSEKEDKTEINTGTAPVDTVHLAQAKQVEPSKSTVTSDTTRNDITGPTHKIEITKEATAAGLTHDKARETTKMRGKALDVKPSTPKLASEATEVPRPTEASTQPKLPSNAGISKNEIPTPAQKTDSTTRPTALDEAHHAPAKKTDPSKSPVTSDNSNKEVSGPAQKSETTKAPTSAAELTKAKVSRPTQTPADTLNIVTPSPEPAQEDRDVSGPAKPSIQLQPSEQSTDSDNSKQKGATPAQEANIITGPTPQDLTHLAGKKHAQPQTLGSPVISETTKKEVTGPAQRTEITTGPTSAADHTKEKAPQPTKISADTPNIKPSTPKPGKEATEVHKPTKQSIQPSESSKSSDISKEDTRASQGTEANLVKAKANESSKSPTSDTSEKVLGSVPETEMPTYAAAVDLQEKAPQSSKPPTNSDTSTSKLSQPPQRPEGKVESPRPLEPADRSSPKSEASPPSGTPTGSSSRKAQEPKPAETSTNERGIQTPKSSPLSKNTQEPMDSGNETMKDTEQEVGHEAKQTEPGVRGSQPYEQNTASPTQKPAHQQDALISGDKPTETAQPASQLPRSSADTHTSKGEITQPAKSPTEAIASQTYRDKTPETPKLSISPKAHDNKEDPSKYSDKTKGKMDTATSSEPGQLSHQIPDNLHPATLTDTSVSDGKKNKPTGTELKAGHNVVEPSSVPTHQQKDPQTTIPEPTPSEQETQAKNRDPEEVPTPKQKSTEQVTNKPPEVSQKQPSSTEETTGKTSEVSSSPTQTPQPDGSRSPTTDFPKSVEEEQPPNDPKSSTTTN